MWRRDYIHQNRFRVLEKLGKDAVIRIDPKKVRHFAPKQTITRINRISRLVGRDFRRLDLMTDYLPAKFFFNSYVLRQRDFYSLRPIEQMKQYALVKDLLNCLPDYSKSKWYLRHLQKLRENESTEHKGSQIRSERDLCQFFELQVIPMISEFKQKGYDADKYPVEGRCFIGPNGEIYKGLSGRHRFAVAALLGISSFPLVVHGVHEQWFLSEVGSRMDIEMLKSAIRAAADRNA
jgi:cell fate (sporulation/competence/biofilm development) regulator YmcA (YheA/YmcA/DUF963 family)